MSDASDFAERVESERERWREYERNRRETIVNCPECGGTATVARVLGRNEGVCEECEYWWVEEA